MDVMLPQASLFLGIIPALLLLYISLKGYGEHYKDKTVFLTFVIGIILGFVAAFVQSFTIAGVIIYIILLAFFDQLLKTMVLNIGRFQEKKESPIYGLSLGLGFGSAFTPFLIIAVNSLITSDVYVLSLIAVGSLGIIMFHGATGAYIGYGICAGKLIKYLLTAIVIQLPFNLLLGLAIIYSKPETLYEQIGLVTGLIIYGIIVFWYVVTKIMPQILTGTKRRKRTKKAT